MNYSQVLQRLVEHGGRGTRTLWDGKEYRSGTDIPVNKMLHVVVIAARELGLGSGETFYGGPVVKMFRVKSVAVGEPKVTEHGPVVAEVDEWEPTHGDILAEDWEWLPAKQ